MLGESKYALALGTVAVTFLILVFSEITPKVIGATHADRIAPSSASCCAAAQGRRSRRLVRQPLRAGAAQALSDPARPTSRHDALTQEELRSLGAGRPVLPRQAPRAARQSARSSRR
jgi:Mg2+/Co2+ transporter CorB